MPGPPIPQPSSGLNEVLRRLGINLPMPQTPQERSAMKSGGVAQGIGDIGKFLGGLVTGPNMSGPIDATDIGGVLSMLAPALLGKIVYHGTPHTFAPEPGAPYGKFDPARVGSGEGAAAFGHGMPYLSDAPAVAGSYINARPFYSVNGASVEVKPWDEMGHTAEEYAAKAMWSVSSDPAQAADRLYRAAKSAGQDRLFSDSEVAAQARELIRSGKVSPKPGNLYEVDLPDDQIALMLDWDARMKDQPANVQRIANEYFSPHLRTRPIGRNPNLGTNLVDVMWRGGSIGAFPEAQVPDIMANVAPHVPLTGQGFYESIGSEAIRTGTRADMADAMKAASEWLRSRGVPGLQYWDQASRAAKTGTRNYVMFDPEIPKIVGVVK